MERSSWIMIGSVVIGAVLIVMGGIQMGKDASSGSGSNAIAAANGAKDEAAKSVLQNAVEAANTYSIQGGTYEGWTPAQGRSIEPSIRWAGSTPARANVVSIDLATGEQLVMSTKSVSGKPFCIGDNAGVVVYGRMDGAGATTATSCTGGW
jgi:hypothetical protein